MAHTVTVENEVLVNGVAQAGPTVSVLIEAGAPGPPGDTLPENTSGLPRYFYDDGAGNRSWEEVAGGGGGGSGTVTSVAVSGGTTGLSTSGGPITGSGTITITIGNAGTFRSAIGLGTAATANTGDFDAAGAASSAVAAHAGATDPHGDRAYAAAAAAAAQAASQPLDSDLTAIAALSTTSFGRAMLALADAAALRSAASLGTLATQNGTFSGTSSGTNTGDQDLSSYATTAAVAAGYQPLDSDLTAIAALTTTSYGRAFLALADAAAGRTALGLGTLATQNGTFSGTSSGTNTGDQTSVTGNAGTATALQTARAINGVNFDGTAAITITSAAGTLTGATLAANVLASSLTSVGTLTGGATGAGFTVAIGTSTITGTLPKANGGTAEDNSTGGTANTFWARPNGATGAAAYRAIVAADVPTLNQNTTGSAATLTTTRTIGGSNFNGSANVTSFPSPGAIGGTTPAAGTFTTLVAGSATSLLVGTAGSAVGSVGFRNATSGTITLAPTTGALGTVTITLPATAGTVYVSGGTDVAVADGGTNLSSYTAGDVIYASGTTTLAKLGIGATGKVLTVIAGVPAWRDPAGDLTTATDGATVTFNLATSRRQIVTLGGSRTLALSNDADGMAFTVILKQDGTGSRTVTWWSGIKWAGGTTPTLTTTAGKYDVFAFVRIASGEYLGFAGSLNH